MTTNHDPGRGLAMLATRDLANVLGAKWCRQFDMADDPRLFELRADLLLLVQMVTGPMPAAKLVCDSCGNQSPTIVWRDGRGGEMRDSCDACKPADQETLNQFVQRQHAAGMEVVASNAPFASGLWSNVETTCPACSGPFGPPMRMDENGNPVPWCFQCGGDEASNA
jgi:hypothetical protein